MRAKLAAWSAVYARLLPGDHIHHETNKVAPVDAKIGAIEAAQLKRMRKMQRAKGKR